MNIYFVNRYSKYKGPFDIIDSNREHIIKVGDICLRDYVEGVEFLVVCSSDNSWKACKSVGIGDNSILSNQGNTLLFSFDGLHKRKGNVSLIKQLIDCYREKVIINFFGNAIDILEYKKDFWDVSLFSQFFASSQELISRSESKKTYVVQFDRQYPSEFAKYLDKELFSMLMAGLNTGNGLKAMYKFLREKEPVLFRTALMKFLAENPSGTIYDKPTFVEIPTKPKVEAVVEVHVPIQEEKPHEAIAVDEDQSFLLNELNNKEFRKLLNRYHKGDKKALEQLVKANLKLVAGLAREYKGHGVEYEDLVQEGTIGLMRAIERFNPNRKVQFSIYAKWWIHQAFAQAVIDMQSTVKIPANQVRLYNKVRKSIEQYEKEHEYEPSLSEIDIEEDIDIENLAYLSSLPDSLQKLTIRSNDWDSLPSVDSADDLLMKEARSHYISAILRKLKKREAYVLRHLYGIGEKCETLSDIGERIGLTRERVRQISEKAVRKLRDILVYRKVTVDEDDSSQEEKTEVEIKLNAIKAKKEHADSHVVTIQANPVLHQDEVKKDYAPKVSSSQREVNEKDNIKVGDDIYYDNRFCVVRKIIDNGKYSKLIVEYSNGVQDFVSYNKSKIVKSSSSSKQNHLVAQKASVNAKSFSFSTSLEELVNYRLITRKQLKHCNKRNLRTIGDVEQIIERYHLTPDSTRFTQYTLDIWFSIVKLLSLQKEPTEKAKESEDGIEHVYVDTPTSDPYIEKEVFLRETNRGLNELIEIKKLETVFENKSTSYKYFWLMAIISLAKERNVLSMTYKDILIRMAVLAWPIVFEHEIVFGNQDKISYYLDRVVKKTSLVRGTSAQMVELYLYKYYTLKDIDKSLSPLLKNVPYRFLSPWIKYTTDEDVCKKSREKDFKGMYALYPDKIIISKEWWHYIDSNLNEVSNFIMKSFIAYIAKYNSHEKKVKFIKSGWQFVGKKIK